MTSLWPFVAAVDAVGVAAGAKEVEAEDCKLDTRHCLVLHFHRNPRSRHIVPIVAAVAAAAAVVAVAARFRPLPC